MYVIIPRIPGASKPNERLYQNDRLHHQSLEGVPPRVFALKEYARQIAGQYWPPAGLRFWYTNSTVRGPVICWFESQKLWVMVIINGPQITCRNSFVTTVARMWRKFFFFSQPFPCWIHCIYCERWRAILTTRQFSSRPFITSNHWLCRVENQINWRHSDFGIGTLHLLWWMQEAARSHC
jgi:hypothetical protein